MKLKSLLFIGTLLVHTKFTIIFAFLVSISLQLGVFNWCLNLFNEINANYQLDYYVQGPWLVEELKPIHCKKKKKKRTSTQKAQSSQTETTNT